MEIKHQQELLYEGYLRPEQKPQDWTFQKQPPEVNCNFIKKYTLAQVFSCEFYEISKNTFFPEHL